KADLPVIIALIQRKDTSIACINPLNVYTHELQELTERNKFIIVEADAPEEIIFHLNRLIVSGVLPKGKLKSIILGAHGTRYTTGVGIAAPSTYSMQSLDQYFMERPIVVLAGCDTGLGRDDEQNLSHFFKLALPSAEIVSCDSLLLGVDF